MHLNFAYSSPPISAITSFGVGFALLFPEVPEFSIYNPRGTIQKISASDRDFLNSAPGLYMEKKLLLVSLYLSSVCSNFVATL